MEQASFRIKAFASAPEFLQTTLAFLEEDDARNNLLVSMAIAAVADAPSPGRRWLCARRERRPVAAALALAEGRIALASASEPDAAEFGEALARSLRSGSSSWRALGPRETAQSFVKGWAAARQPAGLVRRKLALVRQTIMAKTLGDRPLAAQAAPGSFRKAVLSDAPVLRRWMRAFDRETEAPDRPAGSSQPPAETWISSAILASDAYVWETDRGLEATASAGGRTRLSGRVHLVYVPPESRRRGYARSCVAGVCEEFRKEGLGRATLFADRRSEPALELYRSIGFESLGDFEELELDP